MDKSGLLAGFVDNYSEPLHLEALLTLERSLEKGYDQIIEGVVKAYSDFFDKISLAQKSGKKPIAYLNFYLLRSNTKTGGSSCLISAYDKDWYLDKSPVETVYDASYLFEPLHSYIERLHRERKAYVQRVTYVDIEKIFLGKWHVYMLYMLLLLKKSIYRIVELPNWGFNKLEMSKFRKITNK